LHTFRRDVFKVRASISVLNTLHLLHTLALKHLLGDA
jgi:hypothetical protein